MTSCRNWGQVDLNPAEHVFAGIKNTCYGHPGRGSEKIFQWTESYIDEKIKDDIDTQVLVKIQEGEVEFVVFVCG